MSDRRGLHSDVIWRKTRFKCDGTPPGKRRWRTPQQVLARIKELELERKFTPPDSTKLANQREFALYCLKTPHGDRRNAFVAFRRLQHLNSRSKT